MIHKDEIKKLKNGESWIWPESDYGRAEIWRINDSFLLFEIPLYGGEPSWHGHYSARNKIGLDELIKEVESWT